MLAAPAVKPWETGAWSQPEQKRGMLVQEGHLQARHPSTPLSDGVPSNCLRTPQPSCPDAAGFTDFQSPALVGSPSQAGKSQAGSLNSVVLHPA
jgi:hypothetical protein